MRKPGSTGELQLQEEVAAVQTGTSSSSRSNAFSLALPATRRLDGRRFEVEWLVQCRGGHERHRNNFQVSVDYVFPPDSVN